MLETKCVGDNFKILVTVLTIFATNINYFLHERRVPKSCHQYHDVTKNSATFVILDCKQSTVSNLFYAFNLIVKKTFLMENDSEVKVMRESD